MKIGHFLKENGIVHRLCCPYTHEQNGLAERKHRSITETGLTLFSNASLPFKVWVDAFSSGVYLYNRLPNKLLAGVSPFEKLYGKAPSYNHLKTFGCSCFPLIRAYNRFKMDFRSVHCVFLGYSNLHRGYRCWDPRGRMYILRDVTFNEYNFPYTRLVSP